MGHLKPSKVSFDWEYIFSSENKTHDQIVQRTFFNLGARKSKSICASNVEDSSPTDWRKKAARKRAPESKERDFEGRVRRELKFPELKDSIKNFLLTLCFFMIIFMCSVFFGATSSKKSFGV